MENNKQEEEINLKPLTPSTIFISPISAYFNSIRAFIIQPEFSIAASYPYLRNRMTDVIPTAFNPRVQITNLIQQRRSTVVNNNNITTRTTRPKQLTRKSQKSLIYNEYKYDIAEQLKNHIPRTIIAKRYHLQYSQVNNLYNRLINGKGIDVFGKRGRKASFTNIIEKHFEEFLLISNNRYKPIRHLKHEFENHMLERYNKPVKFSTITYYKHLTNKVGLNFSRKRITSKHLPNRNDQNILYERFDYIKKFVYFVTKGMTPIYVDESESV
jgi:hypothetical protein